MLYKVKINFTQDTEVEHLGKNAVEIHELRYIMLKHLLFQENLY